MSPTSHQEFCFLIVIITAVVIAVIPCFHKAFLCSRRTFLWIRNLSVPRVSSSQGGRSLGFKSWCCCVVATLTWGQRLSHVLAWVWWEVLGRRFVILPVSCLQERTCALCVC